MTNKKITVVGNTRKFNIDLSKLPDEILSDLEGISCTDIQQSNFVSKINKAKKPGVEMLVKSQSTLGKDLITFMTQNQQVIKQIIQRG